MLVPTIVRFQLVVNNMQQPLSRYTLSTQRCIDERTMRLALLFAFNFLKIAI